MTSLRGLWLHSIVRMVPGVHAGPMSYPKCGANACNAPQPSAFPGSTQAAALQFTLQLSANQGLLPFGDSQIAAVSYATQALFGPLYGITHLTPL